MDFLLAALTAVFTFISPCVLPLLPVYVTYFAGGNDEDDSEEEAKSDEPVILDSDSEQDPQATKVTVTKPKARRKSTWLKTLINASAFCLGISLFFMTIFVGASVASYAFSSFLTKYYAEIGVVCGIILILFGLKFMGYLSLPFLEKSITINAKTKNVNIIDAFLLGLVVSFSIGMCAMGFYSFSLMNAIAESSLVKSILIGVCFTVSLDILFIVCALLVDQLKGIFGFIKRHYNVINFVSGLLLVVFGVMLALGLMSKLEFGFYFSESLMPLLKL